MVRETAAPYSLKGQQGSAEKPETFIALYEGTLTMAILYAYPAVPVDHGVLFPGSDS